MQDQEDMAAALAAGQPPLVVQNWMYANSVHVIDFLCTLGRGRIVDVQVSACGNPEDPDVAIYTLRFDNGDVGLLN